MGKEVNVKLNSSIITEVSEEAKTFDVEGLAATADKEALEEELGTKGDEPDVVHIIEMLCLV